MSVICNASMKVTSVPFIPFASSLIRMLLQFSQELYGSCPRRDFPNDCTEEFHRTSAAIVIDTAELT
ncbi:hypothetical protein L1987_49966 [Smallanthus sonchifolius]|uniref:Uncharacterized protein n=1 Tax=Smallanthus sonchifolius TaxID=185202 RepID=A0ACB9FWR6_9ASTR|nr:hypothetical protein L1987_49966 [Smallanthus sonchifolius]